MTRGMPKKNVRSRQEAPKAAKRPTGRLTDKPVSDFATRSLARYAAGLPLCIRQLEVVIGINRSTLYRMGSKGPPFISTGRRGLRLYYPKNVEKWLAENSHKTITTNQIEDSRRGQN